MVSSVRLVSITNAINTISYVYYNYNQMRDKTKPFNCFICFADIPIAQPFRKRGVREKPNDRPPNKLMFSL